MKCRIFKTADGICLNWPSENWQTDIENCPISPELQGLEYIIVEETDVPTFDSSNLIEQCYVEGSLTVISDVKQDTDWMRIVMPYWLISIKHQNRLKNKIDAELLLPTPDLVQVALWKQQNDVANSEWMEEERSATFQQALANIVEDGLSKPIVDPKIDTKITELQALGK